MLGTVFHYAVVEPEEDHARCEAQVAGIIAMHERMGYRRGGAYNGHFCIHGQSWVSYTGPNQATGDTWANLNLHAWCYLGTVGTPVTAPAQQAAYDLTLLEPSGRDQIYPHSAFFPTSCCGDPLRDWIAGGAAPPAVSAPAEEVMDMRLIRNTDNNEWWLATSLGLERVPGDRAMSMISQGFPANGLSGGEVFALAVDIGKTQDALFRRMKEAGIGTGTGAGGAPAVPLEWAITGRAVPA